MDVDKDEAQNPADAESRARTYLANERTFLSWLRTGVTLIALGLAAAQFLARDVVQHVPLVRAISVGLVLGGMALVAAGAYSYFRNVRAISVRQFIPSRQGIVVASVLVVLVGILAIVFIVALRR